MENAIKEDLSGFDTGEKIRKFLDLIEYSTKMKEELVRHEIGLNVKVVHGDSIGFSLDKDSIITPGRVYKINFMVPSYFHNMEMIYDTFMSEVNKFMKHIADTENPTIDKLVAIKNEKIQNQRV